MSFCARPAAKVNLTLEVGPPEPDGYHSLRSVFVRIGLSDRLSVRQVDEERDRLLLGGPLSAPLEGNLVLRAATLLRQRVGLPLPALRIELEKHIPLAAGLAGGSSDAAAMLELAAAAWGIGLSPALKLELAMELGSDVPFFSSAVPAALVEGRGELVTALPALAGPLGLLLVTPPVEISSAAAFARFDRLAGPSTAAGITDRLASAIGDGLDGAGLLAWSDRLREANDLWPAAVGLEPALAEMRRELETRSERAWLMSGSGSSLFTFYPSVDEAVEAGRLLLPDLSANLAEARFYATDVVGPDPSWRKP
jgi:4-diphosphocytidyl-2-C-methyl-D-erythritol kinase